MRKHVQPALPGAVIQDLERGKRLPPEGAAVAWTAYWAKLEARGDIVVGEPQAAPAVPPAPEPEAAPQAAPEAQAEPEAQPDPAPQPEPVRPEYQLRSRNRV